MGVAVRRDRLLILLVTSMLAGVVTAFVGPVAFVGVAAPHLARPLVATSDHRVLLPASALIGAVMALVADVVAQLPGQQRSAPAQRRHRPPRRPGRHLGVDPPQSQRGDHVTSTVLETRHLVAGYRRGRRTSTVVEVDDLSAAAGQLTAVIGPNGSGKSTLLRTLVGAQPPTRRRGVSSTAWPWAVWTGWSGPARWPWCSPIESMPASSPSPTSCFSVAIHTPAGAAT